MMKFSIVIPCHNSEKYLDETIESLLNQQGDFKVELIFVDNLSVDSTLGIIEKYHRLVSQGNLKLKCSSVDFIVLSERDKGMYDAINKGFAIASGDILAWINSDDIYLKDAFKVVSKVFSRFHQIQWLKGITSYIDENSKIVRVGNCNLYHRNWIRQGVYGRKLFFLQQSSTFWRRSLWERSGGLNPELKLAGDFDLWLRFAEFAPLFSLNFPTDCFRFRPAQLSGDINSYFAECNSIIPESSEIYAAIDRYRKGRLDWPLWLRPAFYLFCLGLHEFYLVDVCRNSEEKRFFLKRLHVFDFR